MEIPLKLTVTFIDGTVETQDVTISNPDQLQAAVSQLLMQIATVGLIREKKLESTVTLIPTSQIVKAEIALPSIALASGADADLLLRMAKGGGAPGRSSQ